MTTTVAQDLSACLTGTSRDAGALPRASSRFARGCGGGVVVVSPQAAWFQKTEPRPTSLPLEPIGSEAQLDQVLEEAQERKQAVIIEWSAAWCRKCIFLKPKMEKLAAAYQDQIKFYCVDLNSVPKALVVDRGGVSKFPTIQLWKDGRRMDEIIGGKEAWQIMEDIRNMIGRSKSRL
ncbi:hypothetical protein R1sor_006805 [Riccia sorocarpa]|uniref:Thioredoxin domain-containing protein n=1 Tax=Riccia sorocarpa TaxID=122646 RepID=A0ABD3HUX3_9MARC